MEETWAFVNENFVPHWPFILGYIGFYFIGQFVKAQVWTVRRATTPGKAQKFFHFMRRTLAVHAPISGLIIGLIPGIPASPGIEWMGGTILYWGGCGILSSFTFHAAAEWVRKKTKGEVDIEKAVEDAVKPSMTPSTPPKGTEKPKGK